MREARLRASLGPLAEREFRVLFAGQLVSLLGTAIAPIALAFAVLDLTGSASDLGLVLAAGWLPQIVFILIGGVWADRLPRHLVMVGSNLLSGAAQATAAVLLLTGEAQLWHLALSQLIRGCAISFFFPATQGLIPQTVRPGLLRQANALLGMTRNGTQIGGAALGGVLVAATSPGWGLAFDAATYLASAGILTRMRLPASIRPAAGNLLHELVDGWNEFRSRRWLWVIVVAAGFGNAAWVGDSGVLGPLVAKRYLGGAASWGLITAAEGVGLLLGGLVAFRLRPARPLLVGTAALGLTAVPLAVLAGIRVTALIAAAFLAAGLALELFNVYWATALQQHVPLEMLSRVSSYDALGSFVFIPIGLTAAGPIANAIGLTEALWLSALIAAGAMLSALTVKDVRRLQWIEGEPTQPLLEPEPAPIRN